MAEMVFRIELTDLDASGAIEPLAPAPITPSAPLGPLPGLGPLASSAPPSTVTLAPSAFPLHVILPDEFKPIPPVAPQPLPPPTPAPAPTATPPTMPTSEDKSWDDPASKQRYPFGKWWETPTPAPQVGNAPAPQSSPTPMSANAPATPTTVAPSAPTVVQQPDLSRMESLLQQMNLNAMPTVEAAEVPTLEPLTPELSFKSLSQTAGAAVRGDVPGMMKGLGQASEALAPLAEAAGPVGVALMVASAAAKEAADKLHDFRDNLRLASDNVADAASNNYMRAFNRDVDAASESLGKIPIVGQVYSAALQLAVEPIRDFTGVVNSFVERGKQLAAYSPDLALSGAKVEIRDLLADIREADTLGPGMARLQDAQDKAWNEMREILLPLKKWIVETLASIMETLVADIKEGRVQVVALVDLIKEISKLAVLASTNLPLATQMLGKIPDYMKDKLKELRDEAKNDDPDFDQMGMLGTNIKFINTADLPVGLGRGNQMNIPLFGGSQ